jgi:hypothetical protein
VFVADCVSATVTEAWSAATLGATSVNDALNEVVAVEPWALVAVIVTVYGLLSSPVPDQLQVPPLFCVTVPVEAVIDTASPESLKLPVLVAAVFSAALTALLFADTVGAAGAVVANASPEVPLSPPLLTAVTW